MKFELASFFRRLLAYLFDFVPIAIVTILVAVTQFGFFSTVERVMANKDDFEAMKTFQIENNLISSICMGIWIIYSIIMDCSAQQGTFGKKLLGLKVVNQVGERLNFEESFKRNTTKVLSSLPMNFGFLWMLFDAKRQTWHDKIANAFVVLDK